MRQVFGFIKTMIVGGLLFLFPLVIVTAVVGKAFKAVFVRFDDQAQIAFEIERLADGRVTVFLPGAPDPWAGAAVVVDADRVTPLDAEILPASRTFKNLGQGTAQVLEGGPAPASR